MLIIIIIIIIIIYIFIYLSINRFKRFKTILFEDKRILNISRKNNDVLMIFLNHMFFYII